MPLFFPSLGTDTPVGLSFKDTHLHFQTSKLPLREQFAATVSLSCDLWSVGVACWADLKRWTHLAGVWTEHPHTQIHTQQHACSLFVDFVERLQYHRKNNTANVIVCLFAYFVQSVCQMQIESTCQLQHAALPPGLPPCQPFSSWSCANTPSRINRGNKTRRHLCDFGGCVGLWVETCVSSIWMYTGIACTLYTCVSVWGVFMSFSSFIIHITTLTSLRHRTSRFHILNIQTTASPFCFSNLVNPQTRRKWFQRFRCLEIIWINNKYLLVYLAGHFNLIFTR